ADALRAAGNVDDGLLEEAGRLLRWQRDEIDQHCCRRTGRQLPDVCVPARVACSRPGAAAAEAPWEQVRECWTWGVGLGDVGAAKAMLLWHEVRRRCAEQLDVAQQEGTDQVRLAVYRTAADLAREVEKHGSLVEGLLAHLAAPVELAEQGRDWLRTRLLAGALFLAVDGWS